MSATIGPRRSGWRLLGCLWAVVALAIGAGLVTLQVLGPPAGNTAAVIQHPPSLPLHAELPPPAPAPVSTPVSTPASNPPLAVQPQGTALPRVASPVAALQEASKAFPGAQLPRVAADGRVARIVYAAPAPPVPPNMVPVAVLASSFGLSERDSRTAIEQWPGSISFAVSGYAPDAAPLLSAARDAGHEVLASVPMEPQGYPLNDEGSRSLRTGLSPEDNRINLEWALSRTPGAVGATGASDGMRGERFADIPAVFDPAVEEITRRGMLYVDARPGRPAAGAGAVRAIDVVLDDQLGRAGLDAALLSLERTAREKGGAIGLIGTLRPLTVERVAEWSKGLPERGMILVPVSAIVNK